MDRAGYAFVVLSDTRRQELALEAAVGAAAQAGLDSDGANVFRVRSSIHVELPRARAIARVESPDSVAVAWRMVQVARFWKRRDAPVARLVRPELQPFVLATGVVTVWHRLVADGEVRPRELGRAARALHDLGRHDLSDDLPRFDAYPAADTWLDWPAAWLAEPDREALKERLRVLRAWWERESASAPLGTTIIHGDPHDQNAVATRQGIVLVDLEDAAVGPACWDFAPLAAGVRRYGRPKELLTQFIAGYGEDPRNWKGFERMCELYELSVLAWAVRLGEVSSEMSTESALRVDSFLGRSSASWTLS